MTDDDSLAMLREKYREYMALNYEVQIVQAKAKQAVATFELAIMEENKRRMVPLEHQIDLNDGKIKPAAECKPLKLVE